MTNSQNRPWWVPSGLSFVLLLGFTFGPQLLSPTQVSQTEAGIFDLNHIEFFR